MPAAPATPRPPISARTIPLFPLASTLFPEGRLPLQIFEVRYLDMIGKCIAEGSGFGVVALTAGSEVRRPGQSERFVGVGTMAHIKEWSTPSPGLMRVACLGDERFRILQAEQQKHGLWTAQVEMMEADRAVKIPDELGNTVQALDNLLQSVLRQGLPESEVPIAAPYRLDDCGWVANRWAEMMPITVELKQSLLALDNPVLRLELVQDALDELGWLK
ncbi:LON peptidase substrate-binding domain-containing protein [Herbaspirillum sp. AP02]|uniref:LON peptidase substrate-binding domain-containing protein n=1 Tax=unclassified Herbaspirillum TaxID=2624150 RepID=UPI0015D9E68D|nr:MULTISPECIES: LON peptidase substrate-binding domain-containing protein [unclassified Herbaspirillum]MBG7620919.1 LON peptidase substrate-binding domain-containing protein [Herbaspirillum sp. AP02]NZD68382.1 LON peptidase substrate-binding domain-containing protein [Herbaspirillum sp. AP21]